MNRVGKACTAQQSSRVQLCVQARVCTGSIRRWPPLPLPPLLAPWLQTACPLGRRCCGGCPAAPAPPSGAAAQLLGAQLGSQRHGIRHETQRSRCPCGGGAPAAPCERCARSSHSSQRRGQCPLRSHCFLPQRGRCCPAQNLHMAAHAAGRCMSGGCCRPEMSGVGGGGGPRPRALRHERRHPPKPPALQKYEGWELLDEEAGECVQAGCRQRCRGSRRQPSPCRPATQSGLQGDHLRAAQCMPVGTRAWGGRERR